MVMRSWMKKKKKNIEEINSLKDKNNKLNEKKNYIQKDKSFKNKVIKQIKICFLFILFKFKIIYFLL